MKIQLFWIENNNEIAYTTIINKVKSPEHARQLLWEKIPTINRFLSYIYIN